VSGVRLVVNEISDLLGCYVAYISSYLRTFRDNLHRTTSQKCEDLQIGNSVYTSESRSLVPAMRDDVRIYFLRHLNPLEGMFYCHHS
jgi:hypothetical protein